MKAFKALCLALAVAAAGAGHAQSLDSMRKATQLGTVLAAEDFCGFSYDQSAVSDWIDDNVAADDMGFAGTLSMMTDGAKFQQDSMSESSKTAHCRSVERTATHYGFLR